jgi:hypothetical protein
MGVILSAAKDLRARETQVLRHAQDDRRYYAARC